jgi:hypothetical protein
MQRRDLKREISSDIILSIALVVFSLIVLWVLIPGQISVPSSLRGKFLSPAFSPRIFTGFILAMAATLLIKSLLRLRGRPVKAGSTDRVMEAGEPENRMRKHGIPFLIWLSCCLFLMTVHLFGFIFPSIFFLGALMVYFGQRRWVTVVSVMVLTPLILYIIFHGLAKINFPAGILFD